MFKANGNYNDLAGSYLFSEIAHRIKTFGGENVIRMGIGDVTRPLVKPVIDAMHKAVDEMGVAETFRGYGPEQGYDFLREKIAKCDYASRQVNIDPSEIFVSDGAKCDVGNVQELFSSDCTIAALDPVYPVYVDTNVMAGRSGRLVDGRYENIVYLPCTADNDFVPELPKVPVDVIYLCYPNNPTGTALTKSQLKVWVDYAIETGAIIMYDSAYEAYITDDDVVHSIYEIDGAKSVAIEFRSFSKTAGFTGTRCAYTVVPKAIKVKDDRGNVVSLNDMWNRRHCTKFNGVPYVTQRGAEAVYSLEGAAAIKDGIAYYMENAKIILSGLTKAGYTAFGGVNSPYVWLKTPGGDSWAFFDEWLTKLRIVGTPGAGFGKCGEGYFRLTAFSSRENTISAVDRIMRGRV